VCDSEFTPVNGGWPIPICFCATETRTGRTLDLWLDGGRVECPFEPDKGSLLISYAASAELKILQVLGWPKPSAVIDLFSEFRWLLNGDRRYETAGLTKKEKESKWGLIAALRHFGCVSLDVRDKTVQQDVAKRGGPFSGLERDELLAYCRRDVEAHLRL